MLKAFNKQERTIISLAALGGMLEFYDFIIYGVFSVYFAQHFFPSHDKLLVILQSYLIFILGYIARPIGGLIFSYIGDEYGRKQVLIITIVLMGLASLGIGLLPTYSEIGIAAPLILLVLRLLQGLAIGGELPSTYVYIKETIQKHPGLAFGLTMSGINSGLLLGMLINYILTHLLTFDQLSRFGWRIPFIFGGLICLISYQIRKKLQETQAFQKIHDIPKFPLYYLLKHHGSDLLSGIAIVSMMSSMVILTIIFMPTYLHDLLHIHNEKISLYMTIFMITNVLAIYGSGRLAEHVPPFIFLKRLFLIASLGIPLAYALIHWQYMFTGLIILALLQGSSAMITPYVTSCLFESKIRLTGVALSYNIGFTLFGGLAPLVITGLIRKGFDPYLIPIAYLLVMLLIGALGLRIHLKRQESL